METTRRLEHVDHDEARIRWRLGLLGAGAFCALLGLEIATDDRPLNLLKLLLEAVELALTLAAAAGFTLLAGRLRVQREERQALQRDLAIATAEGEAWRCRVQHHLDGLGAAIVLQFETWNLTSAEAEVALLIIKGLSHKEIAALRHTSEATVRQQARSVYDKAGLKGRAALSAFFLEDLLPARAAASAATPHWPQAAPAPVAHLAG